MAFFTFAIFRLAQLPMAIAAPVPYIPPIDDRLAWYNTTVPGFSVKEPQYRGIVTLIYSCTITLLLCVYTALHLDVPGPMESKGSFLVRKIKWTFISLLFPELVVYMAFTRWQDANVLSKILIATWKSKRKTGMFTVHNNSGMQVSHMRCESKYATGTKNPSSLMNENCHSLGAKIRRTWWDLVAICCSRRKKLDSIPRLKFKAADDHIDSHGFTLKYCHFVLMGGYSVLIDKMCDHDSHATLEPAGLILLAKRGHFFYISDKDIYDKSKADYVAKLLVVLQVTQLLIQVVGRVTSGLPIALLELHTVVHVTCALITYFFWKDKPLDINTQIVIDTSSEELQEQVGVMLTAGLSLIPWKDSTARTSISRNVVYRPELKYLEYFVSPTTADERNDEFQATKQPSVNSQYGATTGGSILRFNYPPTLDSPVTGKSEEESRIIKVWGGGSVEVKCTLEPGQYLAQSKIGPNPYKNVTIELSDKTLERWYQVSKFITRQKQSPAEPQTCTGQQNTKTIAKTNICRLLGGRNSQHYLSLRRRNCFTSPCWKEEFDNKDCSNKIRNLRPKKRRHFHRRMFNFLYGHIARLVFFFGSVALFSSLHEVVAITDGPLKNLPEVPWPDPNSSYVKPTFPTPWEKNLWIIAGGFSALLPIPLGFLFRREVGGISEDVGPRKAIRFLFSKKRTLLKHSVIAAFIIPAILGRLFFVFESYFALRDSRAGIFVTVPWAELIPHM